MINTYTKGFFLAILLSVGMLCLSNTSSAYALIDLGGYGTASSSTNVKTSVEVKGNVGTGTTVSSEDETNTDIDLDESSGTRLEVTRDDVTEGDEDADFTGEEAVSAEHVSTKADLQAYARAAVRTDEKIDSLRFSGDEVEVKYQEQGRFLALVPVTFIVSAITHADGTVELNYPWYSFLTIDNHDKLETALKVGVDNILRARMIGSVQAQGKADQATFTAAESAAVAAEMQHVLRSNVEGSAETAAQAGSGY